MNYVLPKETWLGELSIERIFMFYEVPRLFTCRNATNSLFLTMCVDDRLDVGEDYYEWVFLEISDNKHKDLLQHKITLRQAFLNPENIQLIHIIQENDQIINIKHSKPEEMMENLPEDGVFISEVAESENIHTNTRMPYDLHGMNVFEYRKNLHVLRSNNKICHLSFIFIIERAESENTFINTRKSPVFNVDHKYINKILNDYYLRINRSHRDINNDFKVLSSVDANKVKIIEINPSSPVKSRRRSIGYRKS